MNCWFFFHEWSAWSIVSPEPVVTRAQIDYCLATGCDPFRHSRTRSCEKCGAVQTELL